MILRFWEYDFSVVESMVHYGTNALPFIEVSVLQRYNDNFDEQLHVVHGEDHGCHSTYGY